MIRLLMRMNCLKQSYFHTGGYNLFARMRKGCEIRFLLSSAKHIAVYLFLLPCLHYPFPVFFPAPLQESLIAGDIQHQRRIKPGAVAIGFGDIRTGRGRS